MQCECSMGAAWIQYGCRMDATWVDAAWVQYGCSVDAAWVQSGCSMDAAWVHAMWMQYGCSVGAVWVQCGCIQCACNVDAVWMQRGCSVGACNVHAMWMQYGCSVGAVCSANSPARPRPPSVASHHHQGQLGSTAPRQRTAAPVLTAAYWCLLVLTGVCVPAEGRQCRHSP